MNRLFAALAFLLFACTQAAEAHVTVALLPLPLHATIDPFGSRAMMTAAPDGTIAATLTLNGYITRVIVWDRGGSYRLPNVRGFVAGFDTTGALLIDAQRPQRLVGTNLAAIDLNSCESFPQFSTGPVLAGTLSNGALIATMQSPSIVNLDDTSGQNAPVVLHMRSNQCLNMGNGVAMGTGGLYTAGYTALINGVPAPSNVVSSKERFVAMRWHERTREPLGAGVAIAIDADGSAAGADVPPGSGAAYNSSPHARLWKSDRSVVELAPDSPLSVAYAIDDRGRVVGMLEDADRRHYAFLWDGTRVRRLDDVVAAPGWRFECGYAFAPDGAIIGIGTYRGNAAAFEIEGL